MVPVFIVRNRKAAFTAKRPALALQHLALRGTKRKLRDSLVRQFGRASDEQSSLCGLKVDLHSGLSSVLNRDTAFWS
jgi:hypothetical protein